MIEIAFPACLIELVQDNEDRIRIVLEERTALGPVVVYEDVGPAQDIIPGPNDSVFEIEWPFYVACAIRGDRFPVGEGQRQTLVEIKAKSRFAEFVEADELTEPEYLEIWAGLPKGEPAPLRYWRLVCNELALDVASPTPPQIRRLRTAGGEREAGGLRNDRPILRSF